MFEVWTPLGGCDDCQLGMPPLTGFTNAANSLAQAQQTANQIASAQKWSAIMNTISAATTAAATALSRPRPTQAPAGYNPPLLPAGSPPSSADDEDYYADTRRTKEKIEAVSWSEEGLRIFGTTLSPITLLFIAGGAYLLFKEPPRRGGRG